MSTILPLNTTYWRKYHPPEILAAADNLRTTHTLQSTGIPLHIDVYAQSDPAAPTLIFNHGGGGYARLFVPLALQLHQHGYTVLLPDQRGQGLSGGSRSNFEMGQFVQNIVDVAHWARQQYAGPLFMAGASLGGALTYAAAAAGAPISAIVCHNLYDFGRPQDTLGVSRFALLTKIPGAARLIASMTQFLAALFPRVPLPYMAFGKFKHMVDERNTTFYARYRNDPLPIRTITLRYLASTFNAPPAVPFEDNQLPVLVINQSRDKMVDPALTRRNYERLGGPKAYVEIDYGHWALGGTFEKEWAEIVDRFLQPHLRMEARGKQTLTAK